MSLPFSILQVKSNPTFNAMATGNALMFTTDSLVQRFVPMFLHLEVITLTGTLITTPSIALGTTVGGTDIMAGTLPTLGLLNGVNKIAALNIMNIGSQSLPPGTPIYVTVAASAVGPTAYILRPDLVGYYL